MIERAHRCGREVGLCGQAPSDYPDFARFLVEAGIDSISVTPDSFVGVKQQVAAAEAAATASPRPPAGGDADELGARSGMMPADRGRSTRGG